MSSESEVADPDLPILKLESVHVKEMRTDEIIIKWKWKIYVRKYKQEWYLIKLNSKLILLFYRNNPGFIYNW